MTDNQTYAWRENPDTGKSEPVLLHSYIAHLERAVRELGGHQTFVLEETPVGELPHYQEHLPGDWCSVPKFDSLPIAYLHVDDKWTCPTCGADWQFSRLLGCAPRWQQRTGPLVSRPLRNRTKT